MNRPLLRTAFVIAVSTASALAQGTPPPTSSPAPAPPPAPAAAAAPAAVPAGNLIVTQSVPFRQNEPIKLDVAVGAMRVPELRIVRDEASMFEQVVPPRGGVSRFSYLRYAFSVENPSKDDWVLGVRVRLLDRNNAVIDEFEFRKGVDAGRARSADLKRLTLNYAVPLIDKIELTLSGER